MSADTDSGPFSVDKDRYSCITLNTKEVEYSSDEQFAEKLEKSLSLWKKCRVRGIWVRVAIEHASLVPIVTKAGFVFHHTKPDYLMLSMWLSKDEPASLPGYASQYLGCAGFVINDRDQVLVIQERFHTKKVWKLPGGLAEPGEEVWEAAAREVFEETGVRAEFQYLLCFRHQHNFKFGCSDFYFICVMKALTQEIKKCDVEITDAKWMNVDEYANHPTLTESNRYIAECYLASCNQPHNIQVQPVTAFNGKAMTHFYTSHPPTPNQEQNSSL